MNERRTFAPPTENLYNPALQHLIDRNKSHTQEIETIAQAFLEIALHATVLIDHGYQPTRAGYCANGFRVETHSGTFVATALHNVGPVATLIIPDGLTKIIPECPFIPVGEDTALSAVSIDVSDQETSLPLSYVSPQIGDILALYGKRHLGKGQFVSLPLAWGTYLGTTPYKSGTLHQATLELGELDFGDSGAAVVTFGQDISDVTTPSVVGVVSREGSWASGKSVAFSGFYFE